MTRLVHIIEDPERVERGSYAIGGLKIMSGDATDEDIGRGLRTTLVRVHDQEGREDIERMVRGADDLELDERAPIRPVH